MKLPVITHSWDPPGVTHDWDFTIFDSSHVPDGTSVTVVLDVWLGADDTNGPPSASASGAAPVYNKAYVLGNVKLNVGVEAQSAAFFPLKDDNYIPPSQITNPFNPDAPPLKSGILSDLTWATVFYIDTHAAPGVFGDCMAEPTTPDTSWLFANGAPGTPNVDDVGSPTITVVVADGRDTTTIPPYSFVFIDACDTAGSSPSNPDYSLATAFGIYGNFLFPSIDQAFIGYEGFTLDNSNDPDFVSRLMFLLSGGSQVGDAVPYLINSRMAPDAVTPGDHMALPVTWGDTATTLHNTYYGGPTGTWVKTYTSP